MKILLTGDYQNIRLSDVWRRRCAVEFIPLNRLIAALRESSKSGLVADVIVARAHTYLEDPIGSPPELDNSGLEAIAKLVRELRALDSINAMPDGRKWSAIPFIVVVPAVQFEVPISESVDLSVVMDHENPVDTLTEIEGIFRQYRDRLLDELDNLGLLVTYDHGRYRVGPALSPRYREKEGYLYYGPSDQRTRRLYTIDRDVLGIHHEIEQFEALINNREVSENQLQQFFVEHPHFLLAARLLQALPHVSLADTGGKVLIPDFVLKPIVAIPTGRFWT
jgi:hypothetical protein